MTGQPQPNDAESRPILLAVDQLLREAGPGMRGWWPRAVAWLLRIELEERIAAVWTRHGIAVAGVSMRAQLLTLPHYHDPDQARAAAATWYALSRAGHHHAYELAPTQAELRSWEEQVRAFDPEMGRGMGH